MKRLLLFLVIFLSLPAFAQIGRYKSIPTEHYNYNLKLDTATGEVWSIHYRSADNTIEEKMVQDALSQETSQVGRYDLTATDSRNNYLLSDSATGKYVGIEWYPISCRSKVGAKDPSRSIGNVEAPVIPEPDPRAAFPVLVSRDTISQTSSGQPDGDVTVGAKEGDSNVHVSGWSVTTTGRLKQINALKKGIVVVDIRLDESGRVIEARVNTSKSTTIDRELVQAALEVAKEYRFTPTTSSTTSRTGSITVSFNLK